MDISMRGKLKYSIIWISFGVLIRSFVKIKVQCCRRTYFVLFSRRFFKEPFLKKCVNVKSSGNLNTK